MLELLCAIPEEIGWVTAGAIGTLCVMMVIKLIKLFIKMYKERHEESQKRGLTKPPKYDIIQSQKGKTPKRKEMKIMKYIVTATNEKEQIRNTNEVPELKTAISLFLNAVDSNLFPNIMLCDNQTGEVLMHTRKDETPWVAEYIMDDVIKVMIETDPMRALVAAISATMDE